MESGVDRIVDQVVNPMVLPVIQPEVEKAIFSVLGLERPPTDDEGDENMETGGAAVDADVAEAGPSGYGKNGSATEDDVPMDTGGLRVFFTAAFRNAD